MILSVSAWKVGSAMNSCIREDSLPEIESLQRAICLAHKMTGIWCDRYHTAKSNRIRAGISYSTEEKLAFDMYMSTEAVTIQEFFSYATEEKFAFDMYMSTKAVEDYLRAHCEALGLEYKWHKVDKPCSIAGEEFLDSIWDSKTNNWREGGAK